jgi:excisionase family DNA binding protein
MAATPHNPGNDPGNDPGQEQGPGDISDVRFLTVAEVATMMRVSKMTVYRLVHSGELPALRVGRSFRVTEDDVQEYLRKSFYSAG